MGNSASDIISRVNAASTDDLIKQIGKDIELLQDSSIVFSPAKLSLRGDLNNYSVPGGEEKSEKKDLIGTGDEESLVCSQDFSQSAKEKRDQVINNLTVDIQRSMEADISSQEIAKRLQAFCRVFEAILRSDELKKKKLKQAAKGGEDDLNLPASAKTAIKFGLSTLLSLVECVAVLNPMIYEMVVNDTNKILAEMGPLSMLATDSTLTQAFADIAMFFNGVIEGKLSTISKKEALNSFGPLLGLGLSTGTVHFFSTFASKLLMVDPSDKDFLIGIYPGLQQFSRLSPKNYSHVWSEKKKAENISLSADLLTTSPTSNDSGNVFVNCEMTSGVFYFEITVKKLHANTYFGLCEANYSDLAQWNNSSFFSTCYKASAEVYVKANSTFSFEAWAVEDKIGIFIDMSNKKAAFYKNGVKQSAPEILFTNEKLKIYLTQNGESEIVLNSSVKYPEDIKALFEFSEVVPSEFEAVFQGESPSEDFLKASPSEIAGYMIKKIVDLVSPSEYLIMSKSFKFTSMRPVLGLEFNERTVKGLYDLLVQMLNLVKSKNFGFVSEANLLASITHVEKLLKYHLILSIHLDSTALSSSLRMAILETTTEILQSFPSGPQTTEAGQIISSCFEVFYKEPSEKLQYIIESLKRHILKQEVLPAFKEMESQIYKEMARADKLFRALEVTDEKSKENVTDYFKMLIDISVEISKELVEGKKPNVSAIKLLESTQTVILAQAGKAGFVENWKDLIICYSNYFLEACIGVIQEVNSLHPTGGVPQEILTCIQDSIISKILEELLSALVLSPMDLSLISEVLPMLNKISEELGKISTAPPTLTLGLAVVNETYESPHNYLDGSNISHTIRVPNAKKYVLEFDPQCKTENGCDYLELWLDESATNKFGRYEGESFPKEPVEVVNPILHFTFHSDGSVNYWGWKITIKASVECNFYAKQWPDTTKDTVELFFGFCASKLISGKGKTEETSEDVKKVLENPLLKYGVSDKSTLLTKPLPEISGELMKIIDTSLDPPSNILHPSLQRLSLTSDYDTGLQEYLKTYVSLKTPHYSDFAFIVELFEGSEKITQAWTDLKKKCGVFGAGTTIGGNDLDQAERAVFAVYVCYFEIVDTMSKIFSSTSEAGPTVKVIIKQSTQIRAWAQKYKQTLMDAGNNEITYKIVNEIVVKKCAFLLGAEYKLSLKELGVSKVMKNLMSNIAKIQQPKGGLKAGSKWKAVQGAVKSMGKLRGLVSLKKKEIEGKNEDIKEFMRVADLVTGFLENSTGIDLITTALETRRVTAMGRVVGLLSISKLLNCDYSKHNTLMVRSFGNSFKAAEKKLHYSAGLEGTDPKLLDCVQKAFFIVFRSLQRDLIGFHKKEFSYESYIHFLIVIDSLSLPLKSIDTHMLVDQPISATLSVLLDWAKGHISEKPLSRHFLQDRCITRFALLPGDAIEEGKPKILIEKKEDQPSIFLTFDKGGEEKPIIKFVISEVELDLEDAVGEFTHNEVKKRIYIERADACPTGAFLTNITEELVGEYTTHAELLAPANQEERKKLDGFKAKLCKSSWNLYKQLLFSILGANLEVNQSQQIQVQKLLLEAIFPEVNVLIKDKTPHPININALSTGEEWVGKNNVCKEKYSRMQSWMTEFSKEKVPSDIEFLVYSYIEFVDNLQTGSNKVEIQFPQLESCKDESGNYDFFVFLENLKNSEGVTDECAEYFRNSKLWNEEFQAKAALDPTEIEGFLADLEKSCQPSEENSFTPFVELFKKYSGSVPTEKIPENTPAEFNDPDGKLDVFVTLSQIKTNSKHSNFLSQITKIYELYPDFPSTVSKISQINSEKRSYVASILWTLYGTFTSPSLAGLLSNTYMGPLLKFSFLSGSLTLQTISTRMLMKILPSQHSPQSFSHIWADFSQELLKEDQLDIVTLLLKRIGRSLWLLEDPSLAYESQNLLMALLTSDRWKGEVLEKLENCLEEAKEYVNKAVVMKAAHAGAIKFLSSSDGYGISPFVFAVVGLQESSFSKGIVKKVIDGKQIVAYSVIDDNEITVDLKNVIALHTTGTLSLLDLEENEVSILCSALVRLWMAIQQYSCKPIPSSFEGLVTVKAIYLLLESAALSGITNFIPKATLDLETLTEIACKLLSAERKSSLPSKQVYLNVQKEIKNKLNLLSNEPEEFTVEEVTAKIEQMAEEDKAKINEIIAKGLGAQWVFRCWGKGLKDFEAIASHIEVVPVNQIYKLAAIDSAQLSITDVHGTAEIYQSNSYHIVIHDTVDSIKNVKFLLPTNVFHSNKYFVTEVTIRVVMDSVAEAVYKVNIGDLEISVNGAEANVCGNSIGEVSTLMVFRIHAGSNGEVSVVSETTGKSMSLECGKVFTGVNIGEFKMTVEKGNYLALCALEVFDGKMATAFAGKVEKAKKNEGGERCVKVKKTSENVRKARVKLLGVTDKQAEEALTQTSTLTAAVKYSLEHFTPVLPENLFKFPNECISEIKLFDSVAAVPHDFTQVSVLENFEKIEFSIPNQRVIAVKKASLTKDSSALLSISIIENAGGETIGDLSIDESDRPNPVFAKVDKWTPKDFPIRDIVYIKASSIYNVRVPSSYEILTDKEGKCLNIAPKTEKEFYIFIAVRKTVTVLSTAISPLENIQMKGTSYGLAESKKADSNREDKTDYTVLSITELYSMLFEFENSRQGQASTLLLSAILKKTTSIVPDLTSKFPLSKILSIVDSKIFTTMPEFDENLISECISILVSSLICNSGGKILKTVTVESKHPYDNSMDLDDEIRIPGAKGLRIEFDPQCYTESGCDPLRFYEGPSRTGEIKCLSGQGEASWQPFEVPGDIVYTYFHSDGSVNYWGYKFDVIPIGGASHGVAAEEEVSTTLAIKILSELVSHETSKHITRSDKFIAPLYVYLLACQSNEEKNQILDIFRRVFEGQDSETHQKVLKSLLAVASKLYDSTKADKISHSILQSIIMVLCEAQKHSDLRVDQNWFLDLSDLLSDMRGLTSKDHDLELLLFENFKATGVGKMDRDYESVHPYPISTTSSFIKIEGAHSLQIDFTSDSKAEERHTALFTSDVEGKKDIEATSSTSSANATWSIKGPDIVTDLDERRVTRTSSSSWGCAFGSFKFSKGINSITYLIDKIGDSDYMYIGLVEADEGNNYELAGCLNSDNARKVWVWKRSGELIEKGGSNNSESYTTGDTLTFVVNSTLKTIACLKNSIEMFTFTGVAENLVPAACFGGSGQFVVIQSIETIGASTVTSKKVTVPGESAYLWFPVNASAKLTYRWDYSTDENALISKDKRTISQITEAKTLVPTFAQLVWGRHYFQVTIEKPGKVAIGVASIPAINDKNFEDESNILYDSEGTIKGNPSETFTSGDIIACLVDIDEKSVSFYKNHNLLVKLENILQEIPYKFIGILSVPEASFTITPGHPANIDLFTIKSDLISAEWGYKFTAVPEFKGRSFGIVNTFLAVLTEEQRAQWNTYKENMIKAFQSNAVEELVAYVDQYSASKGKDPSTMTVDDIDPTESELIYYPDLEKTGKDLIKKIFAVLLHFNKRVECSLYLFDLNVGEQITDMQKFLLGSRKYIFFRLKNELLKQALVKTQCDTRTEINIDRPKASRHRLKKEVDSEGQFSNFGQIYRAMSTIDNKGFRNSERIYKINYRGEASIDAGGPYNESMSNICDELQSIFLRLLVPIQNNLHNIGENREAWILNPSATSETDYLLYNFLGKLMGAAIRTQNNLNLSLPPLFWKKLLLEPLTIRDLRSMDVCVVQIIEILKNPSEQGLTKENFEYSYEEKFTTRDSSGREVELIPEGKEKSVTFENCGEYADLVVQTRLNEASKAYSKIREGIQAVVPIDYLNLFSWKQLETLVCGTVDVDIDILKENTDYEGCGLADQHIQYFWEVLKEFSPKEKSLYLKFVWGRSRLPSGKDWRHMKVTRSNPNGPVNNYMPVSHTCFFTLDLPAYTNKEAMKTKLLYAVTHCTDIDLDGSAGAGWEDHD